MNIFKFFVVVEDFGFDAQNKSFWLLWGILWRLWASRTNLEIYIWLFTKLKIWNDVNTSTMLIQNLLSKLTNTDNRDNLNLKYIYIYIFFFLGTNAVQVRFLSILYSLAYFSKLSYAMRCIIELAVAIFSPHAIWITSVSNLHKLQNIVLHGCHQ